MTSSSDWLGCPQSRLATATNPSRCPEGTSRSVLSCEDLAASGEASTRSWSATSSVSTSNSSQNPFLYTFKRFRVINLYTVGDSLESPSLQETASTTRSGASSSPVVVPVLCDGFLELLRDRDFHNLVQGILLDGAHGVEELGDALHSHNLEPPLVLEFLLVVRDLPADHLFSPFHVVFDRLELQVALGLLHGLDDLFLVGEDHLLVFPG